MRFELETADSSKNQIRRYDNNSITVNETYIHQNCLITPETIILLDACDSLTTFISSFTISLPEPKPEVILIGTGEQAHLPSANALAFFISSQIGYEFMTTPAACRTYNLLMLEGRKVAAAFFYNLLSG